MAAAALVLGIAAFSGLGACKDEGGGGSAGAPGTGGEGGCPTELDAMFTLTVRAEDGPVPPDTTIRVAWSAAEEPPFALDDPSTWKTLDQANIVCAVSADAQPPVALAQLVCKLWTTGATRVQISATGYDDYEDTLTPTMSEACERFLPQEVDIELTREQRQGAD